MGNIKVGFCKMRRIEQRSSQRRPYLVGEARHHFSQRRKSSLMIRPLLKRAHFRDVREKRDLPRFVAQRAKGQADRLSTRQASLMGILDDRQGIQDIAPVPTQQRLAKKESRHRVVFYDEAATVDYDHPARQGLQQQLQAVGQSLLFGEGLQLFASGGREFFAETRNLAFEVEIGSGQILGKRIEYLEGILQAQRAVESLIGAFFDSVQGSPGYTPAILYRPIGSARRSVGKGLPTDNPPSRYEPINRGEKRSSQGNAGYGDVEPDRQEAIKVPA